MANTTFQGPVTSKNGFITTGPANVVDADASVALTVATHSGRIVHNDAAGAVTYTLPATNANSDSAVAGPGADLNNLSNVGAKFTIVSSITKTGILILQVANATDVMTGTPPVVDPFKVIVSDVDAVIKPSVLSLVSVSTIIAVPVITSVAFAT